MNENGLNAHGLLIATLNTENTPSVENLQLTLIEFSVRAQNCLKKLEVHTIGELSQIDYHDIRRLRGFGHKTLNEIQDVLQFYGFSLKNWPQPLPRKSNKKEIQLKQLAHCMLMMANQLAKTTELLKQILE